MAFRSLYSSQRAPTSARNIVRKSTSRQPKLGAMTTTPVQPRSMPAKPMPTPAALALRIDLADHRADDASATVSGAGRLIAWPRHLGRRRGSARVVDVDQRGARVGRAQIDADRAHHWAAFFASASIFLSVAFDLLADLGEPRLGLGLEAQHQRRLRVGRAHQRPAVLPRHARAVDVDDVCPSFSAVP